MEKKMAGQSVRAGRKPLPARNEGAAGHAGKTLLRKNIRVCILTDPDIFSILNIPYGGMQKAREKIMPEAELTGECFFIS